MSNFAQTQADLAQHLRQPDDSPADTLADIEPRRLAIYENLIFKNIEGFLSGGFPILRQLYNDDDWQILVRDFIRHHESHSPYFLEISEEFLRYLQEEYQAKSCDPSFMLELAHYEWVELALDVSEEELPKDRERDILATDDLLIGLPVVSPLAWCLSYQYPVHQLGPQYQPEEPPEQPTFLIVYRNRQDQVQFMQSNAITVRLIQLLESKDFASGQATLEALAAEIQHPDAAAFVQMGHELLQKLQKSDILF